MALPKPQKLTDQLRQAMADSGLTRYRISQETGVSEPTLSKFHLRQRGLSMEALDALAEFLEITIRVGRKPAKQQKGK